MLVEFLLLLQVGSSAVYRDAHVANCHPASEARHLKCGTRLWLVNTAMFTSWIQLCLSSGFGRAGNKLLA